MLICDDCLEKHYDNQPLMIGSYGRCECCKETGRCYDIPSKHLRLKRIIKHEDIKEDG